MNRFLAVLVLLFTGYLAAAVAQQAPADATVFCTFQDGKQISVQYDRASVKEANFSSGKLWSPGDKPMVLFTQTDLTVGNTVVPVGAYSVYLIPGKEKWTLVINKSVKPGEYSEQQDLVREPMDVGHLSDSQPFSLVFAHVAPKQCNLRVYEAKTGTWAELKEK